MQRHGWIRSFVCGHGGGVASCVGDPQGWRGPLPNVERVTPARRMWTLFEPLHAVTYFAPEGRAAFEAAGLRGFWRGYFAVRSAPLGLAPAAVTIALYAELRPADGRARHPVGVGARLTRARPWPPGSRARSPRSPDCSTGRTSTRRPRCSSRSPPPRPPPAAPSAPPTPPCRGPTNRWPSSGRPPPCSASSAATATSSPSSSVGLDGLVDDGAPLRPRPRPRRPPAQPRLDRRRVGRLRRVTHRPRPARPGRADHPSGRRPPRPRRGAHRRAGPGALDPRRPEVAERFTELATPLAAAARTALPPVNPIGLPGR